MERPDYMKYLEVKKKNDKFIKELADLKDFETNVDEMSQILEVEEDLRRTL